MSGFDGVAWSRYNQVVLHKTSHYTYLLPLQLGFHLADRSDYRLLEPLMFKIGYYFQAQVTIVQSCCNISRANVYFIV